MALTANGMPRQRTADVHNKVVASGQHIYQSAAVGVKPADGLLYKMGAHVTLRSIGCALQEVVGDGVLDCDVREGVFMFTNSGSTEALAETDVGNVCYAVDDNTVGKTSVSGTLAVMGIVKGLRNGMVMVKMGVGVAPNENTPPEVVLGVDVLTLVGSNVYRVVSPVNGKISKIWSVINGVLTTGDATLTGKIGATGITTGVLTITQSGSAAGDVDSAVPTALNTVAEGDVLSVTVGGTNATASASKVTFVIQVA
jgi:hypothetical protein